MSNYTPVNLAFKIFDPVEKGTSRDVILLHGMGGNKEMFDEIGQNIADKSKRRVYALDMRNHGDSSWSDEFSWNVMAVDVSKFMDEHSIKSATLIGHSMGGIVSMILALTEPEKVDSLVIEDISPILPNQDMLNGIAGMMLLMQNCFQSLPPDTDMSNAVKHIEGVMDKHTPQEMKMPEEHREKFYSLFQNLCVKEGNRIRLKANAEVLKNFLSDPKNHTDLEGLCQKPALFVHGSKSAFKVMDDKDRILQLFPNAQFKSLEGASHAGHMELPEEFTEIVLSFLNN